MVLEHDLTSKFGQKVRVIQRLDATLAIWRSDRGYFWLDTYLLFWSGCFYQSKADAIQGCEHLTVKPQAPISKRKATGGPNLDIDLDDFLEE